MAKVTVVGSGFVGMTTAQRIVEDNLADVCLIDIVEGKPQGIALDLMQSGPVRGYSSRIVGTNDPKATYGSDLVIVTAGLPRKPGMDRSDLLGVNGKIVQAVADYVKVGSPNATVLVVTNPLDTMVYLMRAMLGFPAERVIGMAGVLDSARFRAFIAMELGVSFECVHAMVLGGHGDSMVPVPKYATVSGISIEELMTQEQIQRLSDRTRNGGAEIVNLLKTGSAYYAPAASVVEMAHSVLRDQKRLLPCAAYLTGQYGLNDIYMGVPCVLGSKGVERIIELKLNEADRASLQKSADAIRKDLDVLRKQGLLK
ncbi:MAG: malate dehydrogenase [Planctomycetes bacterium]|nr:malate dehydrogenase [Planctomycetota bacterium]